MLEKLCHDVLHTIEFNLDRLGWDMPAVLFELHMDIDDAGMDMTASAHTVLEHDPVASILQEMPRINSTAVGAALATEGWAYGPEQLSLLQSGLPPTLHPSDDPERVEIRLIHLVLRDGTEFVLERRRGEEPTVVGDIDFGGWLAWAVRRSLNLDSNAQEPRSDLALRLILAWQLSHLISFGPQVDKLDISTIQWGSFSLPGMSPVSTESVRESWWMPIEHSVSGILNVDKFANALRSCSDDNPFPLAFPLMRSETSVALTPSLLQWCDNALVVAFLDAALPPTEELVSTAKSYLPRPVARSLSSWLAAIYR